MVTMKKGGARTVAAAEFKAKCLALLDDVADRGTTLVVTKRGHPVARVVPIESSRPGTLIGSVLDEKDVMASTGEDWDAEK
jgi:prevent-host-death family protein